MGLIGATYSHVQCTASIVWSKQQHYRAVEHQSWLMAALSHLLWQRFDSIREETIPMNLGWLG